jgi:membrane protein YqaA with SNARE-associated domain
MFNNQNVCRILALLLVVAISVTIVLFRDRLAGLTAYGYVGLFLLNVAASATLILPVPGLALAFAAGSSFCPIGVGLAVGCGSTVGELTGYLAGYSGRGVVENQAQYERVQGWMRRYGLWVVFVLALIPNPLFDVAGIICGVLRIPVWKFLLAAAVGKVIKATLIAYAGLGTMTVIAPALQDWIGK